MGATGIEGRVVRTMWLRVRGVPNASPGRDKVAVAGPRGKTEEDPSDSEFQQRCLWGGPVWARRGLSDEHGTEATRGAQCARWASRGKSIG
jgi:hypothetical protein